MGGELIFPILSGFLKSEEVEIITSLQKREVFAKDFCSSTGDFFVANNTNIDGERGGGWR